MTTLSLTAGAPPRDRLEQIGLWSLVGIVAAMQLSIAAAQILLGVAALAWLVSHISKGERLDAPKFFWPLVAYAGLTLLSAGFSIDPRVSFTDCKQLVLLMLVPITYDLARGARANSVLSIIITIGAASAFYGIMQYAVFNFDGLGRRPSGTLSHWMTYSGTLMLVICAATARLLYGKSGRLWAAFVMPALLVALGLTLTRGAWVGVGVGVTLLLFSKDLRLLALIPIVAIGVVLLAPQSVIDRFGTMFNPKKDLTTIDRRAMLEAGVAIVKDYPLLGVGPDQIEHVYPRYRVPDAVKPTNPHLHNVPMQIAAERGLLALGAWIWFVVYVFIGLFKLVKKARNKSLAAAAIGGMAAMLAAGITEYNFGDSEFLMLLLVLITLPFAANRDGGLPS
ncbi:MAG TPA: O-antigen ligase family protein [Vicinamibacterales bacterium]|nr:O-antigen ligase family protein [Vicinamibacterales bacterium]